MARKYFPFGDYCGKISFREIRNTVWPGTIRDGYVRWGKKEIIMQRRTRRFIAAVLALSLMLSVTSCKKESSRKKEIRKITEDTPWFNCNAVEVEAGTAPDEVVEYAHHYLAGADDDYIVVYTFGRYKEPPYYEIDMDTFDYNSYNFDVATVIDRNTKEVVNTIDFESYIDEIKNPYESVDSVYFSNGVIKAKSNIKERDIDPLTGELLETHSLNSTDDIFSSYYKAGDYVVDVESHSSEYGDYYSILNIQDPDGSTRSVEVKEMGNTIYVQCVLSLGGNKALVPATTSKGDAFYELDLISGELSKTDGKEYEWLNIEDLFSSFTGSDGQIYCVGDDGIYRIDAEKKKNEEVFRYSWCSLNKGLWNDFELIEYTEDSIIYLGQTEETPLYSGEKNTFKIIELTRAEKNPHAGKTILELYCSSANSDVGKAVEMFNETNEEYFIERIDDYDYSKYFDESLVDFNYGDPYELSFLHASAGLSNDLAMDIMSGDGPDILINTSKYAQLNNPDYLVDLSPYLKELDNDGYFMNIIEGAKTDGALYQLPVSFTIEGIVTDASMAGSSGVGFTLDEYKDFIRGPLNGYDLINSGQAIYFSMLFNSMSDRFIRDGKVDLSGPEFEAIADYVKDNVPEYGFDVNDIPDEVNNRANYFPVTGIGGFFLLRSLKSKEPVILGIPSIDGRGPSYTSSCSVAVSAQATNIDACAEFVKILLSEDIQEGIALEDGFVISRKAFREAGEKAIEYYNNGGSSASMGSGIRVEDGQEFTMQDIDQIAYVVSTCSKIKSEDQAMSLILIEEMPAYFLGQKNLSQVIKIAQNRMQKILDERG